MINIFPGQETTTMKENILLGMPTLIELGSLQKNIEFCRSMRFDLLELNMNLPSLQLETLKTAELPGDLQYSLHLPEELNVWDFNSKVRKAYSDTVLEAIEIAALKNITILNMHMNRGVYFTLPHKKIFLFEENQRFFEDMTGEFRHLIQRALKGTDIKIYIENTGILDIPFIRHAVSSLIESESFLLTWDVGHDASSGFRDLSFYQSHLSRIKHMHLHDYLGAKNHLPLGEGNLKAREILEISGDSLDSIILETKTCEGLKKSLEYFREICP